jgi:hypothetical protein
MESAYLAMLPDRVGKRVCGICSSEVNSRMCAVGIFPRWRRRLDWRKNGLDIGELFCASVSRMLDALFSD